MNAAQHILIFAIRVYRLAISPAKTVLLGPLSHCRFTPSCSAYALQAVGQHGVRRGSWLALKRICRCHPWGGCGDDPVPAVLPAPKQHHPAATDSAPARRPGQTGEAIAFGSSSRVVQAAILPETGH